MYDEQSAGPGADFYEPAPPAEEAPPPAKRRAVLFGFDLDAEADELAAALSEYRYDEAPRKE